MGSLVNAYTCNKWLDHIFNTSAFTPPTNLYVGLSTSTIADSNTAPNITEPSGSYAYARQACQGTGAWDLSGVTIARGTTNTGTVTFPKNTGTNWGTITDWFICDHLSNTTWGSNVNIIAFGTLSTPKLVVVDNTPSIAAGEIDIAISTSSATGGMCTFLVNEMMDHTFRGQTYTAPSVYLGLITDTNTAAQHDAGTYTEVADAYDYAREQYTGGWDAASSGHTQNTGAITFSPNPGGSWGTVTYAILATSGTRAAVNILFWLQITSQEPNTGDTVQYAAGACDITIS